MAGLGLLLSMGEVEGDINVLDDDDRFGSGGDKKAAKMGVGGGGGKLEIVDVKL